PNHPSRATLNRASKPCPHHAAIPTTALVAAPATTTAVVHDSIGPQGSRNCGHPRAVDRPTAPGAADIDSATTGSDTAGSAATDASAPLTPGRPPGSVPPRACEASTQPSAAPPTRTSG